MDNARRVMIEASARLVLQEYRKSHPEWTDDATPTEQLISWLGLAVETFDARDYSMGTFGFMDPDEEEDLIWLCRDLETAEKENLRRFTLAHELGHALLHCQEGRRLQQFSLQLATDLAVQDDGYALPELSRQDPCQDNDVQEDLGSYHEQMQMQESLGGGHIYDPRSERELSANIFAAELLLPADRLYTLYQIEQVPASTLANRFRVSQVALLNRLFSLLTMTQSDTAIETEEPATSPLQVSRTSTRYDDYQKAAIEAPTPALIVAGPGSGKTSTLIGRVEYLVNTLNVAPSNILALTFSRKATSEMEERLRPLLTTMPTVSTFHAFCATILRQYGKLIGLRTDFMLIDEAEGYFLLRQQANALQLRHYQKIQSPAFYFPDILKAISRAKDELVTPDEYEQLAKQMLLTARDDGEREKAEKALEIAQTYALYEEGLRKRGDTDFGGLLMQTIQLLRTHPAVLHKLQQTYQHILVDEFQDVNRASGILLRDLAGAKGRVWVVGDANQAIYGFRGASPANISQFEQDFPGAHVLPLSRNYRSRPDLVAIAESFRCRQLELGEEPGKNQPVRLTHTDAYVTIAQATNEASEINGIIQDIHQKVAQGYSYNDILILCRTRSQVQKISHALAAVSLPLTEQEGILEKDYIKDVLSIFLLLTDSSGMGLLRAARQKAHPLSNHDVEALLLAAAAPASATTPQQLIRNGDAPLEMSIEGRRSLLRISEILQSLEHGAINIWTLLAQYLLIETTIIRDLLLPPEISEQGQKAILADYMHLLHIARHFDQQQAARRQYNEETHAEEQGDQQEPASSEFAISQVRDFLEYLNLLVILRQDNGNRQSSDEDASGSADIVRVMTVHASKGLEFPIVYMPGLVQRRFPSQQRPTPITHPTGMLASEVEGKKGHESGESCLFYVGVTRARDQLILSYADHYGKTNYKRSPYLDALEGGLAQERITKVRWDHPGTISLLSEQQEASDTHSRWQPDEDFINSMRPGILQASALEEYLRCPRKYAYSAIYHFEGEKNGYQLFWAATQRTVKEIHEQREQQTESNYTVPSQQEIQERYRYHWQELGGQEAPFAAMYEEHGQKVVEAVRRTLHNQEEAHWQLRSHYNVDIGGTQVHVHVDRVEQEDKETQQPVRFVRTRFGQRKDPPPADTRELLYTLAYRQHHADQHVEVHSHNLSTGERYPVKMTDKKEQNLYQNMTQALQQLENNEYPAQPAEANRCPDCPFFLICPA